MSKAFWLALQFLTRLPTPALATIAPSVAGRSVLLHPFVGLIIGVLITLPPLLLDALSPSLLSALVLLLWVYLSGALHIDGLADTVDAWVGGHGDSERTLAIMKDPVSGPMGITAIVLLLLLKYVALVEMIQLAPVALIVIPVAGRSLSLLLMLTTPYVREQGLASDMVKHLPRRLAWGVLFFIILAAVFLLQWLGLMMVIVSMVVFLWFRHALLKRLSGFTGDTAGALIELIELSLLLATIGFIITTGTQFNFPAL